MKKILIAGSSNVDITHIGEFIPDEGQTLMAQKFLFVFRRQRLKSSCRIKKTF